MKKIPTIFVRDETKKGHPVTAQIKTECSWVLFGEGIATRKMDGTNVKIENGKFYKRQKPTSGDYDEASYIEVEPISPENKWLMEAFKSDEYFDGIYEACGEKIQGNPEKLTGHHLIRVVPIAPSLILENAPRDFDGLAFYLQREDIEGIVFHHPDGRMAKIKKRDFGLKR